MNVCLYEYIYIFIYIYYIYIYIFVYVYMYVLVCIYTCVCISCMYIIYHNIYTIHIRTEFPFPHRASYCRFRAIVWTVCTFEIFSLFHGYDDIFSGSSRHIAPIF